MTWNCTGGVETSATDENGKTTSAAYTDSYFWRPSSTADQLSNTTNNTYNGQASVEAAMSFGSSTSDVLATLDGLGRTELTQTKEAPGSSTYDSVETYYDSLGRPYKTTLPYAANAGATCSGSCYDTSTTYDALGRPLTVTDNGGGTASYSYTANDTYQTASPAPSGENAKRKQLEYDALGRLTSVCEVTSLTGSAACSQTSSATGYWATYVYDVKNNLTGVTQNAQSSSTQSRSFSYDDLGRMTSEANPESGTTSDTYDTDSTCGTSKGDLVKKVDAVGNVTCYAYDALHRVTSTTYSGPYADQPEFLYHGE
jgi:YD repeat-containing protein